VIVRLLVVLLLIGIGALSLGEVLARLLPVSQGFYLDNVTAAQPIARRLPDRDGVSSSGWVMASATRVRINRQGFIYHRDFKSSPDSPLVALIGDSQIEAPLIPPEKSLSQTLEALSQGDVRVYPVGMSGAPLSQYFVWYRHMRRRYDPDAIVFVISPNDYDESFHEYGLFPGFHYFSEGADGRMALRLREYKRSTFSQIASMSDLIAYMLNNLDMINFLKAWVRDFSHEDQQAKQQLQKSAPSVALDTTDSRRTAAGMRAIMLFFEELGPANDGRPNIHFLMTPEFEGTYVSGEPVGNSPLGDVFRSAVLSNGFAYSELEPAFIKDYKKCGLPLEFPDDVHWSARGQVVTASALAGLLSRNFGFDFTTAEPDCQN
jgi:hypothetical protein